MDYQIVSTGRRILKLIFGHKLGIVVIAVATIIDHEYQFLLVARKIWLKLFYQTEGFLYLNLSRLLKNFGNTNFLFL